MFKSRKRPSSLIKKAQESDSSSDQEEKNTDKSQAQKKRKPQSFATSASQVRVTYQSSGTAASLSNNMSTRQLDVDGILAGQDAEKLDFLNDSSYKGLKGYKEYIKDPTIRIGPSKSMTNVRISSRFDYAPDVCKDYKETGFCGYGDSCKFLHDRGDYKHGWQIDREYALEQEKKAEEALDRFHHLKEGVGRMQEQDIESDSELAFECPICNGEFKAPIITKCGHHFCEACILQHYKKKSKCFVCGENLGGIFNCALDLEKRIAKRKAAITQKEEESKEKVAELQKQQDHSFSKA
jgi:RING finger protein 113A